MSRFPPPNDMAAMEIDGKVVYIKDMPPEVWEQYRQKILANIQKVMSEVYSAHQ